MFQNSSEIKTVLETQYKLFIRSSDALGDINIPMELRSLTPEIKVTDGQANLLGHVAITHFCVSASQRVKMDNPDSSGQILMSINNALMLAILQHQQEQ